MSKRFKTTTPEHQAFLNEVANYGDQVLTEAIGAVLWSYVRKSAGASCEITPEAVAAGRSLSRDYIFDYISKQGDGTEIDLTHVETCATKVGTYAAAEIGNAGRIGAKVFCEAWIKVSQETKEMLLRASRMTPRGGGEVGPRGFAC